MKRQDFLISLLAGGTAGVCVDLVLFPLDTIKTRLQSPQGFSKTGGFRGIYAGVPSTAVGSFPNAAAFFVTYEYVKSMLTFSSSSYLSPVTHMCAASLGEIVACLIRVPSEVIKQRAQVSPSCSTYQMLANTLHQEGIWGLYRGYKSTVLREFFQWSASTYDSFLSGTVSSVGVLKGNRRGKSNAEVNRAQHRKASLYFQIQSSPSPPVIPPPPPMPAKMLPGQDAS
ncbi:S-adenosylmethionine mitochondrial carrier protein isoform X4 [Rhinatrema bivittatum]|uniref:S-adenosylmethionine mitochondrial carrier protein isoform X4 n=1 Tax=Rhinatrema bivittatum TaxID=194408 RepID=UPI00112C7E86|nr:S-adenosylmethionine mitochondrial carrier protein isoform X4 [Rhinatrema bivittatum]